MVVTPSVLVTDRSTCGITVSVSLAVLLAGFESTVAGTVVGTTTVTVLVTEPLVAVTVAVMVKVSEPPEGNVTSVKPDSSNAGVTVAGHTAPPLAAVHAAAVLLNPAAAASVSTEPLPDDGPAFATTIV